MGQQRDSPRLTQELTRSSGLGARRPELGGPRSAVLQDDGEVRFHGT